MSVLTFILHKNVIRELYDIHELKAYISEKYHLASWVSTFGWEMNIDMRDGKYISIWYSQDDEFLDRAKAEIDKFMG